MLALYIITIFVGAAMLFMVQPMVARLMLPLLGGSPSVWNTCMVFFQALLLAGYAYAHWSSQWMGRRAQVVVHLLVVATPLALWGLGLPPLSAPSSGPTSADTPTPWLLGTLLACIGPAFFVLSTCGPLMQRWFASTGHRTAADPYFLYAASNAGSMLALVAYPLCIEPVLALGHQRWGWSIGFAVFALLTGVCAMVTMRSATPVAVQFKALPIRWRTRVRWVLLAMVPSSLMLAVTQYLSTDIAAIPLLWIVPLAIYLLTFILAFARRPRIPLRVANRTLPILVLSLSVVLLLSRHDPIWIIIILNVATLFFGAFLCHGQLAAGRPEPARLTEFYLLIALGGVLGGLFNALVAPVLFDTLLEYPIILAAVCFLRPGPERRGAPVPRLIIDLGLAAVPLLLVLAPSLILVLARKVGLNIPRPGETLKMLLETGVPVLACYLLVGIPRRFALAVGGLLIVHSAMTSSYTMLERRTFFGIYTVQQSAARGGRPMVELLHGTTLHGAQWSEVQFRAEPLIYYHRLGPIGDVFKTWGDRPLTDRVGLVGLGAGTLAAYGRAGQTMTFFEIDPAVIEFSREHGPFTYIRDSKARAEFVLGDARLSLSREPESLYGLIVLDAFSSDAVPVHLLTREAVRMYITRLKPGGILAFHVSNRYLELERVLSGVTRDLGLAAAIRDDAVDEPESSSTLHWTSTWIVVARAREDLAPLLTVRGWEMLKPEATDRVWTDDYSSFVGIFEWAGSR